MPKLVPGIGQRHRLGPLGHTVTGQNFHTLFVRQRVRIESQFAGQLHVNLHQSRRGNWRRIQSHAEVLWQPRIRVIKAKANLFAAGVGRGLHSAWGITE